jgi:hypothetical protein
MVEKKMSGMPTAGAMSNMGGITKSYNKGGGADYMNTVKAKKRGNPAVVGTTPEDRAIKKRIIRNKNSYSGGGMARGTGAAVRGKNFQGIF